jgi:hypothetical protein
MRRLALCALALVIAFSSFATAHADNDVKIILKSSFVDSEGRVNVVGTVRNMGDVPVQVTVGVQDGNKTLQAPTYGRVIWPLSDSPFKFVLEPGASPGDPFLLDVKEVEAPYYYMLTLAYDGMAVGEDRAFVGKIKNTGPFDMHNVSVFAAVHSPDHKSQLDTVRSNVIPVIRPGEELEFVAVPDPAIRQDVLFYSCAGVDFDDPITTLDAGNGQFIAYDLRSVSQLSSFRYDNATDSIVFGVRHYNPTGGPLSLKVPQVSQNQTVAVMMDGQLHEASVSGDGKTLSIDFFIPKGDHQVQIQGIRNVPEFPLAGLALAAMVAAAVAAMRWKAAFKIS